MNVQSRRSRRREEKKTDFCCIKTTGSRQILCPVVVAGLGFFRTQSNERTNEYNNIVELDLNDKKKKKTQQKRKTGGLKNINKI